MNRREFAGTFIAGLAALTGLGTLLQACGTDTSSVAGPVSGGNCLANGTSISIEVVHSPNHTLTIPISDVSAGVSKTYTLADNGSGHTHQVTISAADFAKLQANQGIQEISSSFGHTHTVTVNCA